MFRAFQFLLISIIAFPCILIVGIVAGTGRFFAAISEAMAGFYSGLWGNL
jgi:hypothetical protein